MDLQSGRILNNIISQPIITMINDIPDDTASSIRHISSIRQALQWCMLHAASKYIKYVLNCVVVILCIGT